jgi:hypothetical protein
MTNPFNIDQLQRVQRKRDDVVPPEKRAGRERHLVIRKKGDKQTGHMHFAAVITWLNFAVKGAIGTIRSNLYRIEKHVSVPYLNFQDRVKFDKLLARGYALTEELEKYREEVATFNRTKKLRKMEDCSQ